MKSYDSIGTKVIFDADAYLFDKLDGSNIRAEWNPKKGFYKFGSRTQLISPDSPVLGESINLIRDCYEDELHRRLSKTKFQSAVCFFEFFGPNSFAGSHQEEPHEVVLIDIDAYKKGVLPPSEFLDFTDGIKIPKVLFHGKVDRDIIASVRNGTMDNLTFEGVVGKTFHRGQVRMFKIKSLAWLSKLKAYCGDNESLYNRLV